MSDSPPKITKAQRTRKRILEVALGLFQERGFEETTMRDIAKALDMSVGSTYYHFPSKEELVMAFYLQTQEVMKQVVEELLQQELGFAQRYRSFLTQKLERLLPYRAFLSALFRKATDPSSPLSPFGAQTAEIRQTEQEMLLRLLQEETLPFPAQWHQRLPQLLWMGQMGLTLFWLYDHSPQQRRTALLLARTTGMLEQLLPLAMSPLGMPFVQPFFQLLEELEELGGSGSAGSSDSHDQGEEEE